MLANAKERGIDTEAAFDGTLLQAETELDLMKKLGELPQVVSDSAEKRAPHQMTQYVYDLASLLHRFYNSEKVLDEDNLPLTYARIARSEERRVGKECRTRWLQSQQKKTD